MALDWLPIVSTPIWSVPGPPPARPLLPPVQPLAAIPFQPPSIISVQEIGRERQYISRVILPPPPPLAVLPPVLAQIVSLAQIIPRYPWEIASQVFLPASVAVPVPPPSIGCNLTVAMMRTRLWERLDDDGTYYAPDRVLRTLNQAQNLWCLLTLCIEKTVTLTLTAATPFYSLVALGVTDLLAPLRMTYNGKRLRTATLNQLATFGDWRHQAGQAQRYFQQGVVDLIAFHPQPGASDSLTATFTYAAHPTVLVNDYDVPSISEENQPFLVDLASYLIRLNEGEAELKLMEPFLTRGLNAAQAYASFVRARSKGIGYDVTSFDLESFDRGRLVGTTTPPPRRPRVN